MDAVNLKVVLLSGYIYSYCRGNLQKHVNFQRPWVGRPRFRAEHHEGEIQVQGISKLNQIYTVKVGAVVETSATGGVGVLRDTIDEYFPLGVGVGNIDIVGEKIDNYKNMCEFHNRGRG